MNTIFKSVTVGPDQSWKRAGLFGSGSDSGLSSKKFLGRFRARMQNFIAYPAVSCIFKLFGNLNFGPKSGYNINVGFGQGLGLGLYFRVWASQLNPFPTLGRTKKSNLSLPIVKRSFQPLHQPVGYGDVLILLQRNYRFLNTVSPCQHGPC